MAKTRSKSDLRVRPLQRRGEQRVEAIIEAASAILIKDGFDALTLTAVAAQSHSATGSLYRFFSSREQLIEAIVHRLAIAIEADWSEQTAALAEQDDPVVFSELFIKAVMFIAQRHPELTVLLRHLGAQCRPLEDLAMSPVNLYLKRRATQMTPLQRNVTCFIVLGMIEAAVIMPTKVEGSTRAMIIRELQIGLSSYLGAH